MEYVNKIVDFKKYCELCKHKDLDDYADPCNECLANPTNIQSTKPVCFEEKEKEE